MTEIRDASGIDNETSIEAIDVQVEQDIEQEKLPYHLPYRIVSGRKIIRSQTRMDIIYDNLLNETQRNKLLEMVYYGTGDRCKQIQAYINRECNLGSDPKGKVTIDGVRNWFHYFKEDWANETARRVNEDSRGYRGLDAAGTLPKMLGELLTDIENQRARIEAVKDGVKPDTWVSNLPRLQATAIKAAQVINDLEVLRETHELKMEGAMFVIQSLEDMWKGTPMHEPLRVATIAIVNEMTAQAEAAKKLKAGD
jgi:hypothetical protein